MESENRMREGKRKEARERQNREIKIERWKEERRGAEDDDPS